MKIIGLTGSIGMGKSYVANIFKQVDVPVFDADSYVSFLLKQASFQETIIKEFPQVFQGKKFIKQKLAEAAFLDINILKKLEKLLYPGLNKELDIFIKEAKTKGEKFIVLEIPLLFENNYQALCDKVVVVTASPEIQKERVMRREGMTKERFNIINNKLQMSDKEKKQRADFVIDTEQHDSLIKKRIIEILNKVKND
jgi:dephospho-CoA kinase